MPHAVRNADTSTPASVSRAKTIKAYFMELPAENQPSSPSKLLVLRALGAFRLFLAAVSDRSHMRE